MNEWKLIAKKERLKNPLLLAGLPGIANVGKLSVDFLIDELKAKKFAEFESYSRPNVVFVNEKNLVEMPSIRLYLAKGNRDVLLLAGDYQPVDEQSSNIFCDKLVSLFAELGGKEVIALGGIALKHAPKKPGLFCTGVNKQAVKHLVSGTSVNDNVYGVVGPILGVSGVLLGLAGRRGMNAVCLLAETYGHPMHLGVAGAREILVVLNKKFRLKIDVSKLNEEIAELEAELAKMKDFARAQKKTLPSFKGESNYIG